MSDQGRLFSEFPAIDAMHGRTSAEGRRDKGITRSTQHAEHATPGWNAQADALLREFLVDVAFGKDFLAEEFVDWVRGKIADPPDARSWGGVIQRGAKRGMMRRCGYAPANSSNRSPKCLWRAI